MPADHDYCADPHTAFAIGSARRHRARGVTLALFLGLTKFFRLTFLDLVVVDHHDPPGGPCSGQTGAGEVLRHESESRGLDGSM